VIAIFSEPAREGSVKLPLPRNCDRNETHKKQRQLIAQSKNKNLFLCYTLRAISYELFFLLRPLEEIREGVGIRTP